jgi:hypothetical protein
MQPHEFIALQAALYTLSVSAVVIAAVLVYVLLRLRAQLDRFVTAAERLEAELTPLARDTRVAVDHVRKLSEQAQQQLAAVGAVGSSLLAPARVMNGAIQLVADGRDGVPGLFVAGSTQSDADLASFVSPQRWPRDGASSTSSTPRWRSGRSTGRPRWK